MTMEYEKYNPLSEKELHEIIRKNLNSLEKGLILLEYEKSLSKGIPDFLCTDSGGRIVIIEVKLHQDENILFQALRYFGDVNKNKYMIANSYKDHPIDPKPDPKQKPRIILIAESFSDDTRELISLVTPDIEMFSYQVIELNKEKGIIYFLIKKYIIENDDITEAPKIEGHYEYIKNESLKPVIDDIRNEIKQIDKNINEYVTHGYLGYKYKGKVIAYLSVQRQSFDITPVILDEQGFVVEYSNQRITSLTVDYKDAIKKINESYDIMNQLKKS